MRRLHKALLMPWAGGANAFAYTNKVIALSPIAYWPMAESSGSVALDASGNGRNGAYTGVTLGNAGIGDGRTSAGFDGATAYNNIYSVSLSTAFNGSTGTLALWLRVSAVGLWTDATLRYLADFLSVDGTGNYRVQIIKAAGTPANIDVTWRSNAVSKTISMPSGSSTGWLHAALTWDTGADQVKGYLNGAQSGVTLTGLAPWTPITLLNAATVIGAASTTPTSVWSGFEAHAAIWNTPLSAAQIATLAVVP